MKAEPREMQAIKQKIRELSHISWTQASVWGSLLLGTAAILAEHNILGFSGLLIVCGLLLCAGTRARHDLTVAKKRKIYIQITVVCFGIIVYMSLEHRHTKEKEHLLDVASKKVANDLNEIKVKTREDQSTLAAIGDQAKILERDQKSLLDTSVKVEQQTQRANSAIERAKQSIADIEGKQAELYQEEARTEQGIRKANRSLRTTAKGLSAIATETWRIQHPFLRKWNYTLKLAFKVTPEIQPWVEEAITSTTVVDGLVWRLAGQILPFC